MTFQEFINKLCDYHPEAVVPFLKNRKLSTRGWRSYVTQDCDWVTWILSAFIWKESPEGHSYWDDIAKSTPSEETRTSLAEQADQLIEALQNLKKEL